MSRVGNQPITIPAGITVKVDGNTVHTEGPKGKLHFEFRPEVSVTVQDSDVVVSRHKDDRFSKAFHGTTRALINNMIIGVKDGYEKKLELQGVGYVCNVSGKTLSLRVGLANELKMEIPV